MLKIKICSNLINLILNLFNAKSSALNFSAKISSIIKHILSKLMIDLKPSCELITDHTIELADFLKKFNLKNNIIKG